MKNAILEAKINFTQGDDIPVGCVIKSGGEIVAAAHNMRIELNDVTAHAEILAIRQAEKNLGTSHLRDCEMYVTLEPCPMCAWAIIQSGISTLYFGSYNTQYGAMQSVLKLPEVANSKIKVYGGIEEDECNKILEDFWERVRKNDNQDRA